VWDPVSPQAERAIQLLSSGFRARNPDFRVTIFRHPVGDAHGLLLRWCRKTTSWRPDVVALPDLYIPEAASELAPLAPAIEARLRSLAHPSLVDRLTFDKQLRAVPWWLEPRLLFYWTKAVRQTDWQPVSWEQVLDVLREVRGSRRVWGLGVPGFGLELTHLFAEMLWSLGGELQKADGDPDLLTPRAEEAIDLLVRADREGLCQPELLTWSQPELEDLFSEGKLAALVAPLGFEDVLLAAKRRDFGVAPLPGRPGFASLMPECLAVFRDSPRLAQSQAFLEFVLSADGQARIAEAGGLPLDPGLARRVATTPGRKAALSGMTNVRGLPAGRWQVLTPAIERAVYLAVSGRMPAPRALEEAQAIVLPKPQEEPSQPEAPTG